ncbi:MAG: winged helix-turn-helix domain-containing tetratricopeptide repeat protein [Woeseiaceae bacterium]
MNGPGGSVHLEPKVMGVLVCLAAQAGEVVTRDEFIERVWDGRIVSDEVLSRCISLLRSKLRDNPREPRFIQTVPKIGYRLIVAVGRREATPAAPEPEPGERDEIREADAPPPTHRRRGAKLPAAGLLLVAAAGLLYWHVFHEAPDAQPAARQPSVVVLPFVNHSGDEANEYFSDGLTEELIDRLAHVPGLKVAASTSSFAFRDRDEDVRAIAERLGVDYVLEGNVRRDDDRIRITAQLIESARGFHVWSKKFDTVVGDIFTVQDAIAAGIVAELQPRLSGREAAQIAPAGRTDIIPAWELVLQGRYHLKRREEGAIRRSIELFRQAIELDPGYGDAYRELARAYVLLPTYSYEDQEEMFELAVATIERGIAMDPALEGAARDVLALVHFNRWEWIEAEENFRLALAAFPNDPNVRQWYSQQQASIGNASRSLAFALEAKKLDVLSPVANDRLAVARMWVDDDERAWQQFDLADELRVGPAANPDARIVLLLRRGEYDEARDLLIGLQKLFARASDWIDPFIAALRDPALRPAARAAVARAARERGISPKYLFGAWVYLNDADAAMDVAFELVHEPAEFDVEFLFARETAILRCHPRFDDLIGAIGLDRYWDEYGWPGFYARRGEVSGCG